ncbi:MAG: ATP-binding protein [Janthinobacterium lividum]
MNPAHILLSSDELLQILSFSPNATAIYTGPDLLIQSANETMVRFWGKGREVIGQTLEQAIPELAGQPFFCLLHEVYQSGVTYEASNMPATLMAGGRLQTFYYDFVYRAIKGDDGKVYAILNTATDVTERILAQQAQAQLGEKQAALEREQVLNEELAVANEELHAINEELHESQYRLELLNQELEIRVESRTATLARSEIRTRALLSATPVALAVLTGSDYRIESANNKMLELWKKGSWVIGQPLTDALPELRGQLFLQLLTRTFDSGEPFFGSEGKADMGRNSFQKHGYYNTLLQPVMDDSGKTLSIVMVATDVSEQVMARRKLQRSEEMLRFSLDAGNIGTWYINLETQEFTSSIRLKELFGYYPNEELSYQAAINQITEEFREKVLAAIEAAATKNVLFQMEYQIRGYHDQRLRWVKASGRTLPDESGRPAFFTGVMIDITEQKQDEQRKNDFIGMVSHELKTPLTSLSGYVQLLAGQAKKAEDKLTGVLLDKAMVQLKKMGTMINGFLNLSRLESGKIHLEMQSFDFDRLIGEMMDEVRLTVSTHTLAFDSCKPVIIRADRDKIASVISNLLSNALKYSPQGGQVSITCETKDSEVWLGVKDEGIGIEPQHLDKLFDRFYRVESLRTQTVSGFGIGLYLCSEIIERHQGRLWVESTPGLGSTFYFSLPNE